MWRDKRHQPVGSGGVGNTEAGSCRPWAGKSLCPRVSFSH